MATLAVCKAGHLISMDVADPGRRLEATNANAFDIMDFSAPTVPLPNFCPDCGAVVMTACEHCRAPVPMARAPHYETPSFCIACGEPYPWATREQLVGRLYALLDSEQGLTAADRLQLREAIEELAAPEGDSGINRKRITAAGERIKAMAPGAWNLAQPALRMVLSQEVQDLVKLQPHLH